MNRVNSCLSLSHTVPVPLFVDIQCVDNELVAVIVPFAFFFMLRIYA
jgi:hypothetical protein